MKTVLIPLLGLAMSVSFMCDISAQISQGGTPPSFKTMKKSTLQEIEYVKMPSVDVNALKAEDIYNDKFKDQPWRFGKEIYVDYNPENSGTWDVLEDGSRIWRLGITSKGALSINLTFNRYKLPGGAKLFLYSADRSDIIGAFTEFNNQEDGYFSTTLIKGESVVIEYYEPKDVAFSGELNLWRVVHGYRNFDQFLKSFGDAGDCNVNAACPEGDPYRDQIRSVAVLIIGGSSCTGALINNTSYDETPYFLSADHCYGDPGTAVFWFNWQSDSCENPSVSPSYNSMSGATHRARYGPSDFWLMELNETPPEEYEVYYSGWNRTTASGISATVFGIHHPSGDIKKISWSDGGVVATVNPENPGPETNHWKVTAWSDGTTTEKGSSGSPLFDPNGRIIGQLHGGWASCDSIAPDWYGSLGYSWTGGGTSSTRLRNWLDPLGTGVTVLNGFDPVLGQYTHDAGISAISEPYFGYSDTTDIIPRITIQNYGTDNFTEATVSYMLNSDTTVDSVWTGNLALSEAEEIVFLPVKPGFGEHILTAKIVLAGDENPDNDSLVKYFSIVNCDSVSLPVEEGFNQEEIPPCWNIEYESGDIPELSFVSVGTIPPCEPNEGTHMVKFNSYDCVPGSEIRLIGPRFSTVNFVDLMVSFDWFNDDEFPNREDRVIIQYSYDSLSWTPIDSVIRTDGLYGGWNRRAFAFPEETKDRDSLFLGFLFHSEYGNNCYMDNLEIFGIDTTKPYIDFYADTLIAEIDSIITFSDSSRYGTFTTWEWDFGEGAVPGTATGKGPHDVYYSLPGMKTINLLVDGTYERVKENYVTIKSIFTPPRFLIAKVKDSKNVLLGWDLDTIFYDGFESGDFSQWNEVIEGPGVAGVSGGRAYWHVQSDSLQYIFEGDYGTFLNWGYNIDSWIISPELTATERTVISFIWTSSYVWHVDPNDNGDLYVMISTDEGVSWDPIWTFGEIGVWENWTWYETIIDLSYFADSTIHIAFNVVANNNANIALDNVYIGDAFDKNTEFGTFAISGSSDPDLMSKTYPFKKETSKLARDDNKVILLNYNVYRNGDKIAVTPENTYLDENLPRGTYSYYVTANYENPPGESESSDTVEAEITETGIDPVGKNASIRLFPNPTTGELYLDLNKEYRLTILNMQGAVIREIIVGRHTGKLNLSLHPKGIYILRFEDNERVITRKVVVK
ncbi:MAG: choice-of-anchor J domain-containing protein [Bacteroidales bacterium]